MSKKIIKLQSFKADMFPDKISIEVMREIWNDKENQYPDNQLLVMREFTYQLLGVIIQEVKRRKQTTIIFLNGQNNETEKGDIIHTGEYRRAS
jgi:hypothetical protein